MRTTSFLVLAALATSSASGFGVPKAASNVLTKIRGGSRAPAFVAPNTASLPTGNGIRSNSETAVASSASDAASTPRGGGLSALKSLDVPLLLYFFFWYVGNYYYNVTNKLALKASGGAAGFPMTIASLQLGVGVLYALFLWVAPDARSAPKITMDDLIKMLPVAFCYMGAHCASVLAFSAGAVSFGQIVKSAEPAFAAVLSQFVYGRKISTAKWLCLPVVIGGVILASVKELDFAVSALVSACVANLFAAFKGNENKKLMETEGLKDRLGTVGNQFAVTNLVGFIMAIPFLIAKEGSKWGQFVEVCKTTPAVWINLVASGLWFYGYNELATMTLKKTGPVTQSVANTAKRVIVIVGVALVLGESLAPIKLLGCSIGIFGVFLYSIIDQIVGKK